MKLAIGGSMASLTKFLWAFLIFSSHVRTSKYDAYLSNGLMFHIYWGVSYLFLPLSRPLSTLIPLVKIVIPPRSPCLVTPRLLSLPRWRKIPLQVTIVSLILLRTQCDVLAISGIMTVWMVVDILEGCLVPISRFDTLFSTSFFLEGPMPWSPLSHIGTEAYIFMG